MAEHEMCATSGYCQATCERLAELERINDVLLAACERMRNWMGEPDEVSGYDKKVWDQLDVAIALARDSDA